MLAVDLLVLSPAKVVPTYMAIGKLEHVDFEENLFKSLTQVTNGASMNSNPQPVDAQSATLTTWPSTL